MHKEQKEKLLQILFLIGNRLFDYLLSKMQKNHYDSDFYKTSAYDNTPDPRDYTLEEGAGGIEIAGIEDYRNLPELVEHSDGNIFDQGKTLWCVPVGTTNNVNETNNFLKIGEKKNYGHLVEHCRNKYAPKLDKRGMMIVDGVKGTTDLEWAELYYKIDAEDRNALILRMKKALSLGLNISTGTNQISWYKTGRNGVAVRGKGGGHKVVIVGYNNKIALDDGYGNKYVGGWKVENTWGEKWGKGGYYYIPYDLTILLYNGKYVIITDKEEFVNRANKKTEEDKSVIKNKNNRYYYLLEDDIEKGYQPIFNNLFEDGSLNAGEIKTLIEIYNIRKK